jgi:hypothetical protein
MPKQLLCNIIVYWDHDWSTVIAKLDIGVVLDADDSALALKAFGRVDIDLLLAKITELEYHLLIVDPRKVSADLKDSY